MDGQGGVHYKVPLSSLIMDLVIILENYNIDIPKDCS